MLLPALAAAQSLTGGSRTWGLVRPSVGGNLTLNAIVYGSSSNVYGEIAPCASGVLAYSAGQVPTCVTDIPTAVTIGSSYVYRAGGTDIALLDGGLNASLTASNGGIFYSTATAGAILAGNAAANHVLLSGAATAPTWSTDLLANPSPGNWVMENAAATGPVNLFLGPTAVAHMPWLSPAIDAYSGKTSIAFNDTTDSTTTSFTGSGTATAGTTAEIYAGTVSTTANVYGISLENGGSIFIPSANYVCWTNNTTRGRGASKPFNVCISQDTTSTGRLQLYDDTAQGFVGDFGVMLYRTVPSINFNSGTKQTLITVPTGRTLVVDHIIIRNASTSLTTASCGFGQDANAADWSSTATYTALTGSTLYKILTSPTTVGTVAAAAATFGVKCTILQGGAATVTIDLWYYLY